MFSDSQPLDDLNVISSVAATTQEVATGPIWASLWVFDPQNKPIPDLVTDIPTLSNGLVKKLDDTHMDVTIKLKKGLRWSDGSLLTARDVEFTYKAICDPDTGAATTLGYDHITSTEVKDDRTVVWHFGPNRSGTCGLSSDLTSGIYSPYLTLNYTPVPQSVLGATAHKDWATADYFTKKPTVTSGPYMVQDFTPGSAAIVTLVPNPNYSAGRSGSSFFNHAPYLNKLTYKIYRDKASQIAGFKSGDTDLALGLVAKDMPSLQGATNGKAVYANGLLDEYINFNLGNNTTGCDSQNFAQTCGKPTIWKDDKILRQALELATDKEALNMQMQAGVGRVMNSFLVSGLAPYYDSNTPAFHRDVAKANSMLDRDGWVRGTDGVRAKKGAHCTFTLSAPGSNPDRIIEEDLLISNWKEIGCLGSKQNYPFLKFYQDFGHQGILATGQYDLSLLSFTWTPDPDAWAAMALPTQIPTATNPSGLNWNRMNDPKLTDLFLQGETTIDISKREDIYKKAQAEWRDYTPTIQLYERPDVYGVDNVFGNFFPSVNTCLATCNAPDWYHKGAS